MIDKLPSSTSFQDDHVKIVERETVFEGFFKMERVQLHHRLFEGGWSKLLTREVFVRNPTVGAVMYDPLNDLIGLIEQFRIGACGTEKSPWLFEVVAGIEEKTDESKAAIITRELREEANMVPERLMPICDYFPSPGGSTESMTLFCALGDLCELGGVHGLPEEGEDIRVWIQPAEAILDDLYSGKYNNSATLICLQWLTINRAQLRKSLSNDAP
ncbi:MAG: ADP-ribose pyrophosphatase [Cellvibrionaceae bacterium]|jgi:ADP-ribose pyrophosphatase